MSLLSVPNRECGPCTVCCKVHVILDPALKKLPGVLCRYASAEAGCTIYETRPETCRGHFCAWRQLAQFDESWRPDLSNIYIELKGDPPEHLGCHVLLNPGLKPHAAALGQPFMDGFARALRTCFDMPPEKIAID